MKARLLLPFLLLPVSGPIPSAFAQQPKTKVTLGIKPDYWYTTKGKGVRVKGVIKGGTAEHAGIHTQDIITALNGKSVKDIFAYRDLLGSFDQNDSVVITIIREKKQLVFRSKFRQ